MIKNIPRLPKSVAHASQPDDSDVRPWGVGTEVPYQFRSLASINISSELLKTREEGVGGGGGGGGGEAEPWNARTAPPYKSVDAVT